MGKCTHYMCKEIVRTIKRLDAGQIHLPALVLAVHLSQIRDIERILLARSTAIDIDIGGSLL